MNEKRVKKIQEKMKALDLDGFLVTSKENRQYLTGFTGTFGWVLVTQSSVYLMTDFRYIEQAQQQCRDAEADGQHPEGADAVQGSLQYHKRRAPDKRCSKQRKSS